MRERMAPRRRELYGEAMEATAQGERRDGRARASRPIDAAAVIERALTRSAREPATWSVATPRDGRTPPALLPARVYDRLVGRLLKLP